MSYLLVYTMTGNYCDQLLILQLKSNHFSQSHGSQLLSWVNYFEYLCLFSVWFRNPKFHPIDCQLVGFSSLSPNHYSNFANMFWSNYDPSLTGLCWVSSAFMLLLPLSDLSILAVLQSVINLLKHIIKDSVSIECKTSRYMTWTARHVKMAYYFNSFLLSSVTKWAKHTYVNICKRSCITWFIFRQICHLLLSKFVSWFPKSLLFPLIILKPLHLISFRAMFLPLFLLLVWYHAIIFDSITLLGDSNIGCIRFRFKWEFFNQPQTLSKP